MTNAYVAADFGLRLPPLALPPEILAAVRAGAWIVFNVSGGKDSSAAMFTTNIALDQLGHPRERRIVIHADLGRAEWDSTPEMVERLADLAGLPLTIVRRAAGDLFDRWAQRFENGKRRYEALETYNLIGPWSSASLRFCTSEAKAHVIGPHLARTLHGQTIINVLGIRRDESAARARTPEWKPDTRYAAAGNARGTAMMLWNPIVCWTTPQVFAAHAALGIPLHEAYTCYNTSRLSCRFCVLQSIADARASASAPANRDALIHLADIEATSTFSFQPARWLADTAPALLPPDLLRRIALAKVDADRRRSLEAGRPACRPAPRPKSSPRPGHRSWRGIASTIATPPPRPSGTALPNCSAHAAPPDFQQRNTAMADITDLPVMTQADAIAIGFAGFNDVPHKPIDIPDGAFTITARTSDGRRVTFCFLPDRDNSPAGFVDIQYHDSGSAISNANGGQSPTFNAFGIGRGGRHIIDSRSLPEADRPSILVLLLDRAADAETALPEPAKAAAPASPGGLREVSWSFDGETIYPGYTDDTTWNGFLNVSVDEATWRYLLPILIAGADGDSESLAAIDAMTLQDGRVSLAYGLTTSEADTWWPTQFPDYPVASMPPIPGNWIDKSWRNDTAPSFQVCTGPMAEPVEMWIDYRDPSQREIAGAPRFSLYRRSGDDELWPIYTGDDYDQAMEHAEREQFACMFAKALAGALSATQWQTMRITNRTITPGACASHDHIDANMVMHATWLSLRGADLLAQGRITDVADDLDFINAGWAIAKAEYLTATPEGACFDAWRITGRKVPDLDAAGCETGSDDPAPRPGRVYELGHIEAAQDGRWIVNISNSSRSFENLIDAEGHLWRAYAAAESDYLP